jgi:ATP-dependent helicase/nuclease subunit A
MTTPIYTEEQSKALAAGTGSIAVDAGAGCGKTFVLTERFLSHLDPQNEATVTASFDELVAITFTDAAAREMRNRIREKCRNRLLSAKGDRVGFWRTMLRSLDAARVSTIHSFASGLIRDHAIELGIDPAFSVLDPAEAAVLKSAAVDDALRQRLAPRDGAADEDLIATAAEFDLGGLRDRVKLLAAEAATPEFKRWLRAKPDDLVMAWRAFYVEKVSPRYAREFLQSPLVTELLDLMTTATPVKEGFVDWIIDFGNAIRAIPDTKDKDDALRALRPMLDFRVSGRGDLCGVKDWPDKESKARFIALLKAMRDILDKQRRAGDPESMRRAAELGIQLQHLADDAAKHYGKAKRERGVLDNDDLLVEAHRLLTDDKLEDARRRIAGRVRVLLVDEFQDTDPLQAELVQAILGDAKGGGADAEGRTLFFVGDFKQSIYRFRGAQPEVFEQMQAATPTGGRLTLSKNFRSQPAVLDFVNVMFSPIFGAKYLALKPSRPQVGPRPAVEMLWTLPEEDQKTPAQRIAEAATIAARIRQLIDEATPLIYDKQTEGARPATPGDFAILFRALSDVAAYEQALREAGLPYYLVGGHAFYAQQEVYDVLNLLRAVLSECDEIALAGVLRSPLFGLTDETLFWLAQNGGLSAGLFSAKLPSKLSDDDARKATHARDVFTALRRDKDRIGAAELLRRAFDATGYDATLVAEFLGERKLANLEKLHEQAREADASGSGLRGLTARLTEFIHSPPKEALAATTEGDADVVRLMTVHASKGLEFPIVVLPDLNRKTRGDTTMAVFDKQLGPLVKPISRPEDDDKKGPPIGLDFWKAAEKPLDDEERDRLFYVACTRAADRLILSSSYGAAVTKLEGPWMVRLSERFDLATGRLLDDQLFDGEGADALVEVVPLPPPASDAGEAKRRSLHEAIDAIDSGKVKAGAAAKAVAPVAISTDEIITFSVSRIGGQLKRDSAPAADDTDGVSKGVDPRRLGTLVHAIIERLDPAADNWDEPINRWADALAPQELRREIAKGAKEVKRLVKRFVTTPEWAAMRAAPRLEREVEFLLPWPMPDGSPTAVIRGYLDALYQDASGAWHLVDYKTNATAAAGVPILAEHYELQMAVYAHAIEAATGKRPASLTLIFLAAGVSHVVPWDDVAHAESIRTISEAIASARQSTADAEQ